PLRRLDGALRRPRPRRGRAPRALPARLRHPLPAQRRPGAYRLTPATRQASVGLTRHAPAPPGRDERWGVWGAISWPPTSSDAGAEAAGGANGGGLTHVTGRVEERDAVQHRRARPTRERLQHGLGTHTEPTRVGRRLHARGRHLAVPV